jgi:hypothetical protein
MPKVHSPEAKWRRGDPIIIAIRIPLASSRRAGNLRDLGKST